RGLNSHPRCTTHLSTLSLHDALPIYIKSRGGPPPRVLFQVTIHAARSAYPEVVVHQVVAELSTVVSETGGKATRLTIQHNQCSRSEEHTSELQSRENLVCRLLLQKKN